MKGFRMNTRKRMNTRERVIELLLLKAKFKKQGDKTWVELAQELGKSYARIKKVAKEELDKMLKIRKSATK